MVETHFETITLAFCSAQTYLAYVAAELKANPGEHTPVPRASAAQLERDGGLRIFLLSNQGTEALN